MKTALQQGNCELSTLFLSSRQPEGCIDLIPWDEKKVLFIFFDEPQPLQDFHVIKDVAVLPVEFLSQCIDTDMPHGVKGVEQLEPFRSKVFEESRQVIEIKPFNG